MLNRTKQAKYTHNIFLKERKYYYSDIAIINILVYFLSAIFPMCMYYFKK